MCVKHSGLVAVAKVSLAGGNQITINTVKLLNKMAVAHALTNFKQLLLKNFLR